jgi:hypothetical protein
MNAELEIIKIGAAQKRNGNINYNIQNNHY